MFKRGGHVLPSAWRVLMILPIWVASSIWMWAWWLNSQQAGEKYLYIPLTLAILYEYALLPSIFLYFLYRAKKPGRRIAQPNKRVAVITLCVPSQESVDIVEKQLKAMSEIRYPHDSWILDEGNNKEIKRIAKKYGVKHFTRKGISKYNQALPPFKAKTKAGNVNAWLDRVKRRKYEFFVQLDIDHIPHSNYLDKTLGYFRDEEVAWVQAPSIYKNTEHWTARGAAELELVFQGPLQMGFYGHSETPFIIGSHCTYRMSAIKEIGGFQPTRAEDHLDTVAMSSNGWKGVFLPEIIAEGDGPETLNTYFAQHFAWAYSMFQVLLFHSPKLLKTMSWKRRFQFLFAQTWYPLWSIAYMTMFIVPLLALTIDQKVVTSHGASFLVHFLPMFSATFLIWWAARPLMQPENLRLSWRGIILHAARWPIILRAIFDATFRIKKPYMITPKGKFASIMPSLQLYMPFLLLGFISCISIAYASNAYGYKAIVNQLFFAFMNVLFAIIICTVDLNIRMKNSMTKMSDFRMNWLKPVAAVMALLVTASILVSSTFIKNGVTYAITAPAVTSDRVDVSSIPPSKLSHKEIMNQLADFDNQVNVPSPTVGIFDPTRRIRTDNSYIRHSFVDWRDSRTLEEQLLVSERLGAAPLITLEPRGQDDGAKLLSDISSGLYDSQLKNDFAIMSATKNPVYLRFAHEMDLYDLYPWGAQDPEAFISAYRHAEDLAKTNGANNILWVWSPAGNSNAAAYYPGDDYVNIIGTTILYDQYWYGDYHPAFQQLASGREWLTAYNKPVWVVEFGAGNANQQFQQLLIQDALSHYKEYGFSALVYLNLVDSNIQGPDYRVVSLSVFGDSFKPKSILASTQKLLTNTKLEKSPRKRLTAQTNPSNLIKLSTNLYIPVRPTSSNVEYSQQRKATKIKSVKAQYKPNQKSQPKQIRLEYSINKFQ